MVSPVVRVEYTLVKVPRGSLLTRTPECRVVTPGIGPGCCPELPDINLGVNPTVCGLTLNLASPLAIPHGVSLSFVALEGAEGWDGLRVGLNYGTYTIPPFSTVFTGWYGTTPRDFCHGLCDTSPPLPFDIEHVWPTGFYWDGMCLTAGKSLEWYDANIPQTDHPAFIQEVENCQFPGGLGVRPNEILTGAAAEILAAYNPLLLTYDVPVEGAIPPGGATNINHSGLPIWTHCGSVRATISR